MAAKKSNGQLYDECMAPLGIGYALIEPVEDKHLKIGHCGIIDEHSDWVTVCDLTNHATLASNGLAAPSQPLGETREDHNITWGPLHSRQSDVVAIGAGVGASLEATGLPLSLGARLKFTTASGFAAVLVAPGKIWYDRYVWETAFRDWIEKNTESLMSCPRAAEIRRNGLFVVMRTLTAPKAMIGLVRNDTSDKYFGFDIPLTADGTIDSRAEWRKGYGAENFRTYHSDHGGRRVVGIGGLMCKFKPGLLDRKKFKSKIATRSSGSGTDQLVVFTDAEGDECYEVSIDSVGLDPPAEDEEAKNGDDSI